MVDSSYRPTVRENAISKLIESVAIEEIALAGLINAEEQKILKAIECAVCCPDLIQVNDSVNSTIKNIIKLQMLLQFKLEEASNLVNEE